MNGHKAPSPKFVSALLGSPVGVFGLVLATSSLFVRFCLRRTCWRDFYSISSSLSL